MSKTSESVKVVVRCRPLLEDEVAAKYRRVVSMHAARGEVILRNPRQTSSQSGEATRCFTFDAVYDWNSKQRDMYDETFQPIVEAVLQGYNGTVFAYGQTGSGKTYTMSGERGDPEKKGLIPNSFEHIFSHIAHTQDEQYLVRASYLEIYKEEVRDLLSKEHKRRLKLRERPDTGVYVQDLSSFVAKSVKEVEHVMAVGGENRKVGPTNMNKHSSRSHAIFVLTVECCARGVDGEDHIHVGKLNLVDLAGSERQSKTGATGERFEESTKINLSLSALGNVISALVDGNQSHVPYRDSQLTRLLQDSLGGNAKTIMVANIGPADYNYEETLITLRYANRAKNIQNRPHINEDPKDALLREFQEEILRLKSVLEKRKKKGGRLHGATAAGDGLSVCRLCLNDTCTMTISRPCPELSGGESDGEGGEAGAGSLAARQSQLEAEKEALLHNTELVLEERQHLVAEVQHRVDQLKKEQKKRDALAAKIKAMESKLLAGGKNIVDHTDEQRRKLELQRQQVAKQKLREQEIVQQLEAKEEGYLEIRETFSSLREEVEIKTRKLHKLVSKLQAAQAEIAEYEEEQRRGREELAIAAEEMQKELSLRKLIVDNFIPLAEVDKVKGRAVLSRDTDKWSLSPQQATDRSSDTLVPRPISVVGGLRPMSASARMAAASGNPRYMAENILRVELDMPNRTTHDYECPTVAPSLKAALDRAMTEEEEMTVDAGPFTPHQMHAKTRNKTRLHHRSEPPAPSSPSEHFPTSRGLVTPTVTHSHTAL